jgi:hypothetical protein
MQDLFGWARANGAFVHPELQRRKGRVVAGGKVHGELVRLPLELCIPLESEDQGEQAQFLLDARKSGKWKAYFDILPNPIETAMDASPVDIERLLKNTNLGAEIKKRQLQWRKHALLAGGDREELFWARKVICSRCFPSRPGHPFPMMIPVVDSMNHSHTAKPYWTWTSTHFIFGTEDCYEAGQEIFGNYGPKGDEELVLGYGFAIPNNPYNYVSVKIGGQVYKLREHNPEIPEDLLQVLRKEKVEFHDVLAQISLPGPQPLADMTDLQKLLFDYAMNQKTILQTYLELTRPS